MLLSGTALLMEDEEIVIDVTRAMLERLGCRFMVAETGHEAIDIAMLRGALGKQLRNYLHLLPSIGVDAFNIFRPVHFADATPVGRPVNVVDDVGSIVS